VDGGQRVQMFGGATCRNLVKGVGDWDLGSLSGGWSLEGSSERGGGRLGGVGPGRRGRWRVGGSWMEDGQMEGGRGPPGRKGSGRGKGDVSGLGGGCVVVGGGGRSRKFGGGRGKRGGGTRNL